MQLPQIRDYTHAFFSSDVKRKVYELNSQTEYDVYFEIEVCNISKNFDMEYMNGGDFGHTLECAFSNDDFLLNSCRNLKEYLSKVFEVKPKNVVINVRVYEDADKYTTLYRLEC